MAACDAAKRNDFTLEKLNGRRLYWSGSAKVACCAATRSDLTLGRPSPPISGHSFPDLELGASAGNLPIGLLLRGGTFQRVTFPYSRNSGHCPKPTDLADVQVEVWRLGDISKETTLESYYELFRTDRRFRQSTYRSIEGNLRNRGRKMTRSKSTGP